MIGMDYRNTNKSVLYCQQRWSRYVCVLWRFRSESSARTLTVPVCCKWLLSVSPNRCRYATTSLFTKTSRHFHFALRCNYTIRPFASCLFTVLNLNARMITHVRVRSCEMLWWAVRRAGCSITAHCAYCTGLGRSLLSAATYSPCFYSADKSGWSFCAAISVHIYDAVLSTRITHMSL